MTFPYGAAAEYYSLEPWQSGLAAPSARCACGHRAARRRQRQQQCSIPVSDNSITHLRPHLPTNCVTQQGKYGNRRVVSTTIQLVARHGSWPVVTHNKSQPVDCEYGTATDNATNRLHLQILGTSTLISSLLQHVWHTWTSTTSVSVFVQCWNPAEQPHWLLFSTALTCTFRNTCSCFIQYMNTFSGKI